MSHRKDPVDFIPGLSEGRALHRASAPHFNECPTGHVLPHRKRFGRCTPVGCIEPDGRTHSRVNSSALREYHAEMDLLPAGLEGEALNIQPSSLDDAMFIKAKAQASLGAATARARRAVREAQHPLFPSVPQPPDPALPPDQWVKERIRQLSTYALEMKVFDMLYGEGEKATRAASEILDRSGIAPLKADKSDSPTAPVIILNLEGTGNPFLRAQKVVGEGKTAEQAGPALPSGVPSPSAPTLFASVPEMVEDSHPHGPTVPNRCDSNANQEATDQASNLKQPA